jgi:hypothetical protein
MLMVNDVDQIVGNVYDGDGSWMMKVNEVDWFHKMMGDGSWMRVMNMDDGAVDGGDWPNTH